MREPLAFPDRVTFAHGPGLKPQEAATRSPAPTHPAKRQGSEVRGPRRTRASVSIPPRPLGDPPRTPDSQPFSPSTAFRPSPAPAGERGAKRESASPKTKKARKKEPQLTPDGRRVQCNQETGSRKWGRAPEVTLPSASIEYRQIKKSSPEWIDKPQSPRRQLRILPRTLTSLWLEEEVRGDVGEAKEACEECCGIKLESWDRWEREQRKAVIHLPMSLRWSIPYNRCLLSFQMLYRSSTYSYVLTSPSVNWKLCNTQMHLIRLTCHTSQLISPAYLKCSEPSH